MPVNIFLVEYKTRLVTRSLKMACFNSASLQLFCYKFTTLLSRENLTLPGMVRAWNVPINRYPIAEA